MWNNLTTKTLYIKLQKQHIKQLLATRPIFVYTVGIYSTDVLVASLGEIWHPSLDLRLWLGFNFSWIGLDWFVKIVYDMCSVYGSVAIETPHDPNSSLSLLLKRNAFCLKLVYKGEDCLIELFELPKRH